MADGLLSDDDVFGAPSGGGALMSDADVFGEQPKPSVGKDVGKSVAGNIAPNAAVNIGAGIANAPYTAGSYVLQLGTKAGEYAGEGIDELARRAANPIREAIGKQPLAAKSQADYDEEQKDLMNGIRSSFGLKPTESGDISELVPTPSNLLKAGTDAVGAPLYQPQTKTGQVVTDVANAATAGKGSGMGAIQALRMSVGSEAFDKAAETMGLPKAVRFFSSVVGGGAAAEPRATIDALKGAGGDWSTPNNPDLTTAKSRFTGSPPPVDVPPSPHEAAGFDSARDYLRAQAKPAYDYAEKNDANLNSNFTDGWLKGAQDKLTESPRVTNALGQRPVNKFVDNLQKEFGGTPMTLSEATDIVHRINDEMTAPGSVDPKTGKLTSSGNQLFAMKMDLMDRLQSAPEKGQITGGPASLEAWKVGQDNWARSFRAGEIEHAISTSRSMDNPDVSMRLALRRIVNKPTLFNKYEPQEQEYLKLASQTGITGEVLRAAGGRLVGQGLLAAGHVPMAIGDIVMAKTFRAMAANIREGKANKVIDQIVANAKQFTPPPDMLRLPPPQLQLPPPSGSDQVIADPTGMLRPVGGTEAFALDQNRQRIQNMGRSPDVAQAGAQHPGAPPEDPAVTQARAKLQQIAQTGKVAPETPAPAPPPQAALPPPQQGQEMIAGAGGVRPSTQTEDFQNQQARQAQSDIGLTPDVRRVQAMANRPSVQANLSAATGTIPGLDRLVNSANNGDAGAHEMLNRIAQAGLEHLTSGIPSARVDVTPSSGLYGGSLEPSLGVKLHFNEEDRPAAMAALAKFGQNFNQQEVHVREAAPGDKLGKDYGDGSFATTVHRYNLKSPMSREQIEKIAEQSGLDGFTSTGNSLETYFTGDPNDAAANEKFRAGTAAAEKLIGTNLGSHSSTTERLWRTGSSASTPYTRYTDGNLRAPKETASDIPRLIGERHTGASVRPAVEADITPRQRQTQERIAKTYDALPENDLGNPLVQRAYTALAKEVKEQFENLPIKVDIWNGKGEPYGTSAAMRKDLLDNNHLYIFKTSPENFGPHGSDFSEHPLLQDSGLKSSDGTPLLMNDLLRAVHDYYAHATSPVGFGPKGEEAAWKNHMASTKDPYARWALTSETRGQNSWVNFRPGAEGLSLPERQFAVQKAALLPIRDAMTGDASVDAPMRKLLQELPRDAQNGSMFPELKKAWRAESGYHHDKGTSAADVVRYEKNELGNENGVDPKLMPMLEKRSPYDVVWVAKNKGTAERYGDASEYRLPAGYKIIGHDNDGGYLVLLPEKKYAAGGRISDAQKEAGNYKKEHIAVHGLPISIENKAGSIRRGKDHSWKVKMPCAYGYFKRTEGADGDHVDCFVGPHPKSDKVFIINQNDHTNGKFDEHKVMLGFASEKQARSYYEKSFSDGNGKKRIGSMKPVTVEHLKEWLGSGNMKRAA